MVRYDDELSMNRVAEQVLWGDVIHVHNRCGGILFFKFPHVLTYEVMLYYSCSRAAAEQTPCAPSSIACELVTLLRAYGWCPASHST